MRHSKCLAFFLQVPRKEVFAQCLVDRRVDKGRRRQSTRAVLGKRIQFFEGRHPRAMKLRSTFHVEECEFWIRCWVQHHGLIQRVSRKSGALYCTEMVATGLMGYVVPTVMTEFSSASICVQQGRNSRPIPTSVRCGSRPKMHQLTYQPTLEFNLMLTS